MWTLQSQAAASHGLIPLLADSDLAEQADTARNALSELRSSRPSTDEKARSLLHSRRQALQRLLDSDNRLRKDWNARLAAAAPRGIAVSAGTAQPLANAFVTLHVLRNTLHCTLPIVVLHWGMHEVTPATRAFFWLHLPGVTFVDISLPELYPSHHMPLLEPGSGADSRDIGYKIKTAALYLAPFREVCV